MQNLKAESAFGRTPETLTKRAEKLKQYLDTH
jgi:hypothetical protein